MSKKQDEKIAELERRIRELEQRPIYYPVYPPVPPPTNTPPCPPYPSYPWHPEPPPWKITCHA